MPIRAFFCIITLLHYTFLPAASQSQLEPALLSSLYPALTQVAPATPLEAHHTAERSSLTSSLPIFAAGLGYTAGHLTVRQLMQQPSSYASALGGIATALIATGLTTSISAFSATEEAENSDIIISAPSAPADSHSEVVHLQSALAQLNICLTDNVIDTDYLYARHKFYTQWQQVADAVEESLDAQEDDADALEQSLMNFLPAELLPYIKHGETVELDGEEWTICNLDDQIDHEEALTQYAQAAAIHRKEQAKRQIAALMTRLVQIKSNTPHYL